ncbi:bacterial Ig-like domain-containing protein, partial [Carnobacterium gallinarum]
MKKKFLSLFSVMLLVSSSLIGTVQAFAETTESEQTQEQEDQTPNKVGSSDSLENSSASESNESIVRDSVIQTNSVEVTNSTISPSESSTNAHEQDSVLQEENINGKSSLLADTIVSGNLGSVAWEIDADGTLRIDGGQLPNVIMINNRSPFDAYKNQIISIIFEGKVTSGGSLENLFFDLGKVKSIENLSYLDTSQTINMQRMFFGMTALTSIDVSGFDTSKVSNMIMMFNNASSLTSLDLSDFDTSSVTNMGQMFYGMKNLTSLDLSNFETSNLTNMYAMFSYSGIKSLNISNFNTLQAKMGADIFWQTPIEHIKLGENFVFKDSLLGSPPIDNTYIGKWQNQSGTLYTSLELATNYNGATMNGDWYWATSQEVIEVIDSSIYIGDKWEAKDNFISAKDKDGNVLDFADITVDASQVDINQAGTYEVKYSYGGLTSHAKVTVKDKQTVINVHDSTIYVGDTWKAEDNFDSALDKDGNIVNFEKLTVDASQVDINQAGTYEVKYSYGGLTSHAKVTVKDKQTVINVHDSTIYVGDTWKAED